MSSSSLLELPALFGRYVWLSEDFSPLGTPANHFSVSFTANAPADIHVALSGDPALVVPTSDGRTDGAPEVEAVVGGWMNTRTAIRGGGREVCSTRHALRGEGRFWLSVDGPAVCVGTGTAEPLCWGLVASLEGSAGVTRIGLSSWKHPITYSNIAVGPPVFRYSQLVTRSSLKPGFAGRVPHLALLGSRGLLADAVFRCEDYSRPVHMALVAPAMTELAAFFKVSASPDVIDVTTAWRALRVDHPLARLSHLRGCFDFLYEGRLVLDDALDLEAELYAAVSDWLGFQDLFHAMQLVFVEWKEAEGKKLRARAGSRSGTADGEGEQTILETELRFPALDAEPQLTQAEEEGGLEVVGIDAVTTTTTTPSSSPSSSRFLDLVVRLDDGEVRASRLALAAYSEVFLAMLTGPLREGRAGEVLEVPGVPAVAFWALAASLVRGGVPEEVAGSLECLSWVLTLAVQYGLPRLQDECAEAIQRLVTLDNVGDLVVLAELHRLRDLRRRCLAVIVASFTGFVALHRADFCRLGAASLCEVVADGALAAESELEVLRAVELWVASDPDRRLSAAPALLERVRFPQIPRADAEAILGRPPLGALRALAERYFSDEAAAAGERAPSSAAVTATMAVLSGATVRLVGVDWARVRRTPRLEGRWVTLKFVRIGDGHGALEWLGTEGGRRPWVNPHKKGEVTISCSSPVGRYTRPEVLAERTATVSTSYCTGTVGDSAWFAVDLGPRRRLICTDYVMAIDRSTDSNPRGWCFQGATDPSGPWDDLMVHSSDTSLSFPGASAHWEVPEASRARHPKGLRVFRVRLASNAATSTRLCLARIELYGELGEMNE